MRFFETQYSLLRKRNSGTFAKQQIQNIFSLHFQRLT